MKSSVVFLMVIALVSCSKDEETDDTILPVIILNSPTNNQVFAAGQTVNINAAITDNKTLDQIHLEIINNNTGTFVTHEHYSPAGASYTLTKSFTTQAATSYKIKVEAHDDNDNIAKMEIMITSN